MSKIIRAQDILSDAQSCVECIFLAAANLDDQTDPIQTVANIASRKIAMARALLGEYRTDIGVGDGPAGHIGGTHDSETHRS